MKNEFLFCEYFNSKGKRVHRILIADDGARVGRLCGIGAARESLVQRLEVLKSEAQASGASTRFEDGATAVQALIVEVTSEKMPLAKARKITQVGVNFGKAVFVADVVPMLEASFGGHSASWAKAIFRGLKQGPASVH